MMNFEITLMANILIADDSNAIRLVLNDILSIGKHSVVGEAKNGEEAVEMFFKLSPDLLLLDLAMPKKDGLTVVKEIMEKQPQGKIILITASDDQKTINQCLELGASSYISKPFDINNVLKQINDSL